MRDGEKIGLIEGFTEYVKDINEKTKRIEKIYDGIKEMIERIENKKGTLSDGEQRIIKLFKNKESVTYGKNNDKQEDKIYHIAREIEKITRKTTIETIKQVR